MKKTIKILLTLLFVSFSFITTSFSSDITADDVIKLKKAGVSDEVIINLIVINNKTNSVNKDSLRTNNIVSPPLNPPQIIYIDGMDTGGYKYFYYTYIYRRQIYFNQTWYPVHTENGILIRKK